MNYISSTQRKTEFVRETKERASQNVSNVKYQPTMIIILNGCRGDRRQIQWITILGTMNRRKTDTTICSVFFSINMVFYYGSGIFVRAANKKLVEKLQILDPRQMVPKWMGNQVHRETRLGNPLTMVRVMLPMGIKKSVIHLTLIV